ncbi:MAG: hypothetical protein L3J02_03180 [Henriciella sp.]|nr:hypothetical protein [Henriciella sp.]
MHADIVRLASREIDIKIVNDDQMHVLQWRRNLFWDEVLLDGKRQAHSRGLWGREKVYGLVFGRDRDGQGGKQVMLIVDPKRDDWDWTKKRVGGVRLEGKDGPIIAYGTLDPQSLEKPATFANWRKKTMGMDWG